MMEELYCPQCGGMYFSSSNHECPRNPNVNYDSYRNAINNFAETPETNQISAREEISYLNYELLSAAIRLSISLEGDGTSIFPLEEPIGSPKTTPGFFQGHENSLDMTPHYSLDNYQDSILNSSYDNSMNSFGASLKASQGNSSWADEHQWISYEHISSQNNNDWCKLMMFPEQKSENMQFGAKKSTTEKKKSYLEYIIGSEEVNSDSSNSTKSNEKVRKKKDKKEKKQKVDRKTGYLSSKSSRINDCSRPGINSNAQSPVTQSEPETPPVAGPSGINTRFIGNDRENFFVCDVCYKGFRRKHNFKLHYRTHTGDKPYVCGECGNRFAQNSTLRSHIRIHTGEKSFKCSVCGKRFARYSHLQDHFRIHTGEKPFNCKFCSQRFSTGSGLYQHCKKKHAEAGHSP